MRIYISGAITNNSKYFSDFAKAQTKLYNKGYSVINPALVAQVLPDNLEHEDYMHVDFALLDLCDAIYMLEGWEQSAGANREYGYALAKGKAIIFEQEDHKCKTSAKTKLTN